MKIGKRNIQILFERINSIATTILGNSVTFIVALLTVIIFLGNSYFYSKNIHLLIGDTIIGITFLSLFIIQKSFNRFSASLHLKVNELVSSNEAASNAVLNISHKTEREINILSQEYLETIEILKEVIDEADEKAT